MLAVVDFKQFCKSFTYSRNNIGPRLELCGTPQETVREKNPSGLMLKVKLMKFLSILNLWSWGSL
jgi:hypothetical protein